MHPTTPASLIKALPLELLRQRRTEKWGKYGPDVVPAWVAEMDFELAPCVTRAVEQTLQTQDVGYPLSAADSELSECFAQRMQTRFGWSIDPGNVEVLSDVVQGLYACLNAFTRRGDAVLLHPPIYPPFLSSIRETERRAVLWPLEQTKAGFRIDWDNLPQGERRATRLLLLCNPHNPTGRVFRRAELERLAALALEHDWLVVADEIHADLTYPGSTFVPFASLGPDVAARTITLTSATKAFNIPGLRCALAHFGTPQLQSRFNQSAPPHGRGGLNVLGMRATLAAWTEGQPWLDALVETLAERRDFVISELRRALPEVSMHSPEATYLAWLDCTQLALPEPPAQYLRQHAQLALSDGHLFGPGYEQCARLNFATSAELLSDIMRRLTTALQR